MSRLVALTVAGALLLTGCGGDDASGCTELREPEDPASFRHVIGPDGYEYLTDPPTSGPHVGGAALTGLLTQPLDPVVQVRILESGHVLVQYDPATVERAAVEGLVDAGAVVAPGADLPAPIVATAWTWKLTCGSLDADHITRFVEERAGEAPGAD